MPNFLFSLLDVISSLLVHCGNGIGWDSGLRPLYITSLLCTSLSMNIRVSPIPDDGDWFDLRLKFCSLWGRA